MQAPNLNQPKGGLKAVALWTAMAVIVSWMAWYGHELWLDTYDASRPMNPISAVLVSDADLGTVSACARDVVGARLRNNLNPTRSDLFYAEWRCNVAAKKVLAD